MVLLENKMDPQTVAEESEAVEETINIEDARDKSPTEDVAEATEIQDEREDPCAEVENRYLRLLADFENYKKRTAKEKEDIYKYANQTLLESILPVLDAFELAMKSLPEEPEEPLKGFGEGINNIQRQLMEVLEKTGLERIEALGEIYDPVYHEAIMMVPDDSVPPHTIIDELRAGYIFKERVIRPTVCRVSEEA